MDAEPFADSLEAAEKAKEHCSERACERREEVGNMLFKMGDVEADMAFLTGFVHTQAAAELYGRGLEALESGRKMPGSWVVANRSSPGLAFELHR